MPDIRRFGDGMECINSITYPSLNFDGGLNQPFLGHLAGNRAKAHPV